MSPEPATPKLKKQKTDEHIAELEAKLGEAKKNADIYLTQLMYARADLDNIQKQAQLRSEEAVDRANVRILAQLLTIADELGLAAANGGGKGVEMVHVKLLKLLEQEGVKPMEPIGRPFDPYQHEALMEIETAEHPTGSVVEEIRRGYKYKDKVLRACMVKVSRAPSSKED
jgi:molecular chaperone GrpE